MTSANDTPQMKAQRLSDVRDSMVAANDTYVFISTYTPWGNTVPDFEGTVSDTAAMWREMIYGKKVTNADVGYVTTKNTWSSGTVYESYSQDHPVTAGDFYVITDERKVFKCIDNNLGSESVSKPTSTSNATFTTADGYTWKYMYTAAELSISKFGTSTRMPVEPDANVVAAAVGGTVDAVVVLSSGNNWTAHDDGSVLAKVSNNIFQISSSAVPSNGYYDESGFYVTAGSGAGHYSRISSYVSNSSGNFVNLETPGNTVTFGSSYTISPRVVFTGDGSGAVAYSVVNASSDTVHSVRVVNVGSGYTWANVSLVATVVSSNTSYTVNPVVSPFLGHGADPVAELGATEAVISVSVSNADSVPSGFSFGATGVLKSPVTFSNTAAAFTSAEFSQFYSANVTLGIGVTDPPTPGETVTGQTSGATGTVLTANSTHVRFNDVVGTFTVGENVLGAESSSLFSLDAINNPSLAPHRGQILLGSHFTPVTRSASSTERVKFIVKV